jgi:hypothetical protein
MVDPAPDSIQLIIEAPIHALRLYDKKHNDLPQQTLR